MADQRWWMVLDPYLLTNDVIVTSLLFLTIIYVLVNFRSTPWSQQANKKPGLISFDIRALVRTLKSDDSG